MLEATTSTLLYLPFLLVSSLPAAIDYQWTGMASSGAGDVAYLLWGGVIHEALSQHEDELLKYYHSILVSSFPPCGVDDYSWEEFKDDYDLEFLAYFQTALPQLLNGMTRQEAEKNHGVYGWLTYEADPQLMAWGCRRAAEIVERLFSQGAP